MSDDGNPGEHVRWYANRCGWSLGRRNIILEGNTDVRYFELAANMYREEVGRELLGRELTLLSAGSGKGRGN